MPAIGHVTMHKDGTYSGRFATLSIQQNIQFVKNKKTNEAQPDFIIMAANDIEIGAAWIKKAISSGNEYVSLSIAAPEFGPRTLYANLGRNPASKGENDFVIIWNPVV